MFLSRVAEKPPAFLAISPAISNNIRRYWLVCKNLIFVTFTLLIKPEPDASPWDQRMPQLFTQILLAPKLATTATATTKDKIWFPCLLTLPVIRDGHLFCCTRMIHFHPEAHRVLRRYEGWSSCPVFFYHRCGYLLESSNHASWCQYYSGSLGIF